jgi:hypothetical protein
METRIFVLGPVEFATTRSEALGATADVPLLDKNDSFVLGSSKLDVMFGRAISEAARLPYREYVRPRDRPCGTPAVLDHRGTQKRVSFRPRSSPSNRRSARIRVR